MLYADAPDPFQLDGVLRDNLILNHLIQGRLYEDDLQDGITLSNLANYTFTVSRSPGTWKKEGVLFAVGKLGIGMGILCFCFFLFGNRVCLLLENWEY